jgi:hypothetical protein
VRSHAPSWSGTCCGRGRVAQDDVSRPDHSTLVAKEQAPRPVGGSPSRARMTPAGRRALRDPVQRVGPSQCAGVDWPLSPVVGAARAPPAVMVRSDGSQARWRGWYAGCLSRYPAAAGSRREPSSDRVGDCAAGRVYRGRGGARREHLEVASTAPTQDRNPFTVTVGRLYTLTPGHSRYRINTGCRDVAAPR